MKIRNSTSTLYSDSARVTDNIGTVAGLLSQPRTIVQLIANALATSSVTSAVFGDQHAAAAGGAVLYQVVSPSDLVATSDISERTEGGEYQMVTLPEPKVVQDPVEDLGGKFAITDECKERNIVPMAQNGLSQLTATIRRKLDERTVDVLTAAADEYDLDIEANDWTSFETRGSTPTPRPDTPLGDLVAAALSFDQDEMGVRPDRLILNPSDAAALRVGYGDELPAVLAAAAGGDTPVRVHSSARVPLGTGYVLGGTNPGGLGVEKPLTVDLIDKREARSTIVQAYIVARPFVSKPYAVRRLVGLAG